MSEIRSTSAMASSASTTAADATRQSRAAASEGAASASAAAPSPAATPPTTPLTETTARVRDASGRVQASQERVSQLQGERAQVRERRAELRAERQAERQEAREQRIADRQAEREARRAERQEAREQRRAERQAQDAVADSPAPAPDVSAPEPSAPPAETESPAPAAAPAEGIRITGSVRQTSGEFAEREVAFDDSTVARERGVAGVAIDDPGNGVTFRFEEAGNGRVTATRYEVVDGEEVAVGSQTLQVTSVGSDRGAAAGVLSFDQIGLQVDLDDDFTPGDLQFVEISSGPQSGEDSVAGSLTSVQANEERAVESRRLDSREQQLTQLLSSEESNLTALVEGLPGGGAAFPVGAGTGSDPLAELRVFADSLVAQGSPTSDRVMQLLR
jgi:TolA-binding protein